MFIGNRLRRAFTATLLLTASVLTAAVMSAAPAAAANSVMNFNNLANNFGSYTTYSQNGMTVAFTTAGEHLHAVSGSGGTTGAKFFGSDGWPATFSTGAPFNLVSIDIVSYANGVTFTATPGGATVVASAGTLNFPAGFQNITSVTMTEQFTNDSSQVTLDNITFAPTEPVAACVAGAQVPAGYNLIQGTSGNDTISGTSGKDLIRGLAGNDTIYAYSADDIVCGNEGNDVLYGGSGDDVLSGGPGNDTLNGESGTDRGLDNDPGTTFISIEKIN